MAEVMLMLPNEKVPASRDFLTFSDYKKHETHLPELQTSSCFGSSFGWLFTINFATRNINLLNPITRAQIPLPPLDLPNDRHAPYIHRAIITADPSLNRDFVVVVILSCKRTLAFCKARDTKWTTLIDHGDQFEDVTYHDGRFYAIVNHGQLISRDGCDVHARVKTLISGASDEPERVWRQYLVSCPNGELWKANREMDWDSDDDDDDESDDEGKSYYHTLGFSVFRFDKDSMMWVKLDDLRGNALFLGYNSPICVSTLESREFKANCIYYTDDFFEGFNESKRGCSDIGIYRYTETNPYKKLTLFYNVPTNFKEPCIWVTPNSLANL